MGAAVSQVTRGSAADKGGIVDGDIIVNIDGNPILRSEDLPHMLGLLLPVPVLMLKFIEKARKKL